MRLPSTQRLMGTGKILKSLLTASHQHLAAPSSKVPASSAATANISKLQQPDDMCLPGQGNDHSSMSPKASQRSMQEDGRP